MQHHLIWQLWRVERISFAPIIADRVREDASGAVEVGRRNGAAGFGVPFEAVLGVFIPKVKGAVAACSAEGPMDRVKRNGVHRVDI